MKRTIAFDRINESGTIAMLQKAGFRTQILNNSAILVYIPTKAEYRRMKRVLNDYTLLNP